MAAPSAVCCAGSGVAVSGPLLPGDEDSLRVDAACTAVVAVVAVGAARPGCLRGVLDTMVEAAGGGMEGVVGSPDAVRVALVLP